MSDAPPNTRDAAGTVHPAAGAEPRIVSLVPSLTELVCDLGLAERLVGRTGFCIHPWETVRRIPKVGGTKDVDLAKLRALEPTHVLLNVDENRRETADALSEFVEHVIVTHPLRPRDNLALYRLIGAVFGVEPAAESLCEEFERTLAELRHRAAEPADVLYLVWRDPWMTIAPDTYIARTLELVGWRTLPRESETRYPEIELSAFAGAVDRVLLSSEPFHFKQGHVAEVAALVPGAEVTLIDGEMTSWYGSRAISGLRYLDTYARGAVRT
ncbi:MAG TPA: helical backbone metal receptor [Solirubrobacteraceae bacterium]|nr:helical backbone metal receptor [Solirubrobacteraceae bacterium]